ncbi:MAG TPA: Zn-ribbon domain-containing OB-fold protein [Ktedonobacterales bacterium]|nr:Zn-ribbon domain-containing OB-fold protein [Ktedonobacterales bacterium]
MAEHIPVPMPDGDSKVFWEGVKQGKLLIQRCDACQRFIFYPRSICPHCFADTLSWVEAQGTGTIYSYTVVHRAFGPFAGQAPYMVAIVELAEGVRMMTRITGSEPNAGAVRIGAAVRVVFVEADEDVTLPYFQLV